MCVYVLGKGGGGGILRANPGGGGSWVGNLRVFLFFRPPPFFPSLLLSRFAGFLPLFFLFVFSDFHFLLSPIRDGRWKGEGGDSGGLSFVFSSVPSSQKKTIPSSPSPPFDPTFLSLFLFLRWRRRASSSSFPSSPRPPAPPHISFVPKRRRGGRLRTPDCVLPLLLLFRWRRRVSFFIGHSSSPPRSLNFSSPSSSSSPILFCVDAKVLVSPLPPPVSFILSFPGMGDKRDEMGVVGRRGGEGNTAALLCC